MSENRKRIYEDGTYIRNNPDWHQADSRWKASKIVEMLERNKICPGTVSEIGCGAGEVLRCVSDSLGAGVKCTGFEISPQALDMCRQKIRPGLNFLGDDLLQVENARFDLLLAIDVLEHIEDCFGFVRTLRSKAAYKVFHIPLDLSVQSVLRVSPILKLRRSVGHIHYFTKETALALIKDAGYAIDDAVLTFGSVELPRRGWKATLMKWPRRLAAAVSPDLSARILGGASILVLAR
jgi:cyclopropane fatty-acyl-phospholipid synthase-like methyltransferase